MATDARLPLSHLCEPGRLPGDRDRVRSFTVISLMDRLRRRLLD